MAMASERNVRWGDQGRAARGGDARGLTRRGALLLPLLLAACGGEEEEGNEVFRPLRYNYLPPIELNVASISIEQRFVPAGVPPDVSNLDPVQPVDALKAMASDRLTAFGTANTAVFDILNASLTRQGDVISGDFEVTLSIRDSGGNRLGYALAQVTSQHSGISDGLRRTLYDMTKSMMSDMNVEFEYQIRQNLKPWLTSATAPDTPVQQTPLDQSGNPVQPGQSGAPADQGAPAPTQLSPPPPQLSPPPAPTPPPGQPSGPPASGYPRGYLVPSSSVR